MRFAIVDGIRSEPKPSTIGLCPGCGGDVRAKCGEVLRWHWAHVVAECDPWSEPESEWHLNWKSRFPDECQEVVVGPHRADVLGPGAVLEIQASGISVEEVREREEFYGQMAWMLKGEDFAERLSYKYKGGGRYALTWKAPRKTWATSSRRLLVDLDGEVMELLEIGNPDSTPWVIESRFLSGEDIYELVLGKDWGIPECGREWCQKFSELHLRRTQYEETLDSMKIFIEKWWRYTYHERKAFFGHKKITSLPLWTETPSVYEDSRLQRQVWNDVEQCSKKVRSWLQFLGEFDIFFRRTEAERIARDFAFRREQEEAARISAEKARQFALARQKEAQLDAKAVATAKRTLELLRHASAFAREANRGDLCDEIIALRPVSVKVLGSFSASELSELLQSFIAARDRLGENEWKKIVEAYRA